MFRTGISMILLSLTLVGCSNNVSAEDCEYFYDTMANLRDSAVEARNSGDEAGYDFYDDAMYEVLRTMPEEC